MTPFLFRCPTTRLLVQGLHAEDEPKRKKGRNDGKPDYVSVECLACGLVHIVDPATGKVAGES